MPIGTGKTFITQSAVDSLAQERSWLRGHPDYPEYLLPVNNGDKKTQQVEEFSIETDDISSEFDDPSADPGVTRINTIDELFRLESDWIIFPTATSKRAPGNCERSKREVVEAGTSKHRVVLVRVGNKVCQVWQGPRTRQRHSVLGRLGSITIICHRIQQELYKFDRRQTKVTIGELARFISAGNVEAIISTAKLLDRVDQGHFVNGRALVDICKRLRLVVEDVAFVHPTIFAGDHDDRSVAYDKTKSKNLPWLSATPWSGAELELYERITSEGACCKLNRGTLSEAIAQQIASKIKVVFDSCYHQDRERALWRLTQFSRRLGRKGLAAWVSYIAGSGDGDPDGRAKLIITIEAVEAKGRPPNYGALDKVIQLQEPLLQLSPGLDA